MAKVLKPFLFKGAGRPPGRPHQPGDVHHKQLARNGLVEPPKAPKAAGQGPKAKAKPAGPRTSHEDRRRLGPPRAAPGALRRP
jgi:hypothetical protein